MTQYKHFKDQLIAEHVPTEYLNLYREDAVRSAFFQTAYLIKYGNSNLRMDGDRVEYFLNYWKI